MKDSGALQYQKDRILHWDHVAGGMDRWRGLGGYYQRRLQEVYRFLIPVGQKVLEVGCGEGDLLAAVKPAFGVGLDFSLEMVNRARKRHPELFFIQADAQYPPFNAKFDFIILSDLVNDLWDVQAVLKAIKPLTTSRTRLILNTYSRLWELPLAIASRLRLANPRQLQNWLTVDDLADLLYLGDFDVIRTWQEVLWPVTTPLVDVFFNRFVVKTWPARYLALANFILASPRIIDQSSEHQPFVSVVVPARNEAGNIQKIFSRTPNMGEGTELIFVEGHSHDDTQAAIERAIAEFPHRSAKLLTQKGEGKGDAVRLGFSHARGHILMILDADLTVAPEDLLRFYEVLQNGKGEFVNGVRLVYPMEHEAMRYLNQIGNKFFSLAFTWLLGQPIKDTLCGTKALWRSDYEQIASNRAYFGDFDPFGDFDLLFGAAKLGLKIVEVPIRYRQRTYGSTNIKRWKHGWLLAKMTLFASRRIKFV
jgi:SAM-dependent methyltransferase